MTEKDIWDYIQTISEVKSMNPVEVFKNLDTPSKIVLTLGVGAFLLKASQSLIVSHRVYEENRRQDRTYYDPSTRMRWDLRRKPSNYERAEILRRRETGEDIYDILKSLGLSK